MSLFKTREFWNTQCGDQNEEFDQFSIHVTNIDNASDNSDKIIVGSHSGMLRIYGLRNSKLSSDQLDVDELGYNENDLLIEMQFPLPILQVKSGILLSASDKRQLLILFPQKFGVYSVSSNEGLSGYGFSYSIIPLYEHELKRMAFCVTIGPFGQVKGRDFVCIQGLDCSLMFFEQETASFTRTMLNSLLPTSFTYLPTTDTFLIQSADWVLQCFRYQMLAISAHQDEKNSKNIRKVIPDWTFELGEPILSIETVCLELNASLIVILGERNLFVLRSDSTMFWQKKFDFKPIYCHSYFSYKGQAITDSILNKDGSTSTKSKQNQTAISNHTSGTAAQDQKQSLLERDLVILLITEMSTLLIYNNKQLRWTCKNPQSYCQVQRTNFYFTPNCELVGCLTFLSNEGHLALAFLGTNPSLNVVNNAKSSLMNRRSIQQIKSNKQTKSIKEGTFSHEDKEQLFTNTQMDKDQFDKELNELNKIINAYNSDFNTLIKLNSTDQNSTNQMDENDLTVELINFEFDTMQDSYSSASSKQIKSDKQQYNNVIDLEFNLESKKQLSNLVINLNVSNCFNITPNLHNFVKLESSKENGFSFRLFYDSMNRLVSFRSNQIILIVNYFNEKNLPRVLSKLIELPINFFCRLRSKHFGQFSNSGAGSSTNTSQNSAASQRSLKEIDQNLEKSLDHYLMNGNLIEQTNNAISFQFSCKKSNICLTTILHDLINYHNLNSKLAKKIDEDNLKSNKVTIQFFNSKLRQVHVEFISPSADESTTVSDANDKSTYRVIIIGDDLHSNCFVSNFLIAKLSQLHTDRTIDKILFHRSSIPIKEYFELIDHHLGFRSKLSTNKKQLQEHCERLRVIEKRILIKLRDRNISNLNNLESLLNVQHQKIMLLVNEILQLEQELEDENIKLNCCNQLIFSILKSVSDLNEEESQLLEGSFNILPLVQANDLETWQERTESSLTFLLRNHMKDSVNISKVSSLELVQPDDCENLFKLIKMVIEKSFMGNLFGQRSFGAGLINKNNLEKKTILEVDEEGS